ncbi:MAG: GrdX family protein [Tissierellia bacterium]|nr:GrdX family protein [Tissierellia bacterium]
MLKKYLIITNNIQIHEKLKDRFNVEYIDCPTQQEVLERVRTLVHGGYVLETHPLSGSIKPNETPYKSVILSENTSEVTDMQSLLIIEDTIAAFLKFQKNRPILEWYPHILKDFQDIDTSLLMSMIDKLR